LAASIDMPYCRSRLPRSVMHRPALRLKPFSFEAEGLTLPRKRLPCRRQHTVTTCATHRSNSCSAGVASLAEGATPICIATPPKFFTV